MKGLEDRTKGYRFDQIFTPSTSQSEVYKGLGISPLVKKVVEGYHATVFAYGQTGSGKTYTMEGYDYVQVQTADGHKLSRPVIDNDVDKLGVTQRAVMDLFREVRRVKEEEGKHVNVFCSFLQIYNERVFDLLNGNSVKKGDNKPQNQQGLRIRWTKKEQFVVENLYVFECATA